MRIYYYVLRTDSNNLRIFNTNVKINMMNGKYFILYNCTVYIEYNIHDLFTVTFVFNYDENDSIINFYNINKDIDYKDTDENGEEIFFGYSWYKRPEFIITIGTQKYSGRYTDEQYKKILPLIEIFD